ncbi:MAG: Na/Pi cotransporter family protein [Deltaproteobacteria bacterium]|nr:Na/Pi cotransporter family protein [Deltaproteobacteria bacterium]MBW2015295.1 Na/Pi cotransporter family protein [Deltaproteobacteria bacterium]MBW2127827.1 Na/Pi cotransporter family protein [Deltaproteobacteria bacterium]MBW2302111.1 Na/Pi cotransporter family protein [Deltaproteobacteria bacterium]
MMEILFKALGGLGLFLFGMKIMSEGLQKVAGTRMRKILNMVSNNRLVGCAVGTLVTSVIQSSSATTVMLVGFVDAGLMSLTQAIGVILGANIGTTVTAQLIAFKIQDYALPAIALGVFLKFFIGRRKWVYVGDVFLGFGLVFYGLATMKAGFSPLKHDPSFVAFFTRFSADNLPSLLLCILAGTGLTMFLQSSSATVGITMALASQGLLTYEASVALILGDNIGTTITAELASIGGNLNAHRTARAHTLFNVIGVINIIIVFPLFIKLVTWSTSTFLHLGPPDLLVGGEKPNIARYIANAHTAFNVINASFFLLFLPYLIKVATWLTPAGDKEKDLEEIHHVRHLDSRFIDTPSVALGQAKAEILRMGEAVQVMYSEVVYSLEERRVKELIKWRKREDALDILQKEITHFLVQVAQKPISPEESKEVASLLRMTNNLERIGDAIENIAELIEELIEQNLHLSEGGLQDYKTISLEVGKFIDRVIKAIEMEDKGIMEDAQRMEETINRMREEMRGNYLVRMQSGVCTVDPGLILVDMLTAFEKMGDYCYNIAQAIAGVR